MGFVRKTIVRFLNYFKSKLTSSSYLLIGIFLIAIALRLWGVYPGYPLLHPDEPTIYSSVKEIVMFGNFKPVLYSYGMFLSELYAFSIVIFFIPVTFLKELLFNLKIVYEQGFFGFLDYFNYSQLSTGSNFMYWSRYLTAILGSLTVIIAYILGKKLFSKSVGLLAAFLLAINYRHLISSVFSLPDAPVSFFALLSVLLSFNLIKSKSRKVYVWAGLGLALALSVKYYVYVIPTFFLCHLLSVFYDKKKSFIKKILSAVVSKNLFIALITCLASFSIINYLIFFDFHNFYQEYVYDSARFRVNSPLSSLFHYDYHKSLTGLYYLVRYGIGEFLSFAIIIGFFYALLRKTTSTIILLFVIAPVIVVFLMISAPSSARYYTSIIPFLLFFPAFLIMDILKAIRAKPVKIFLLAVIIFILAFPSIKNSFLTSLYFSQPQNQTLAVKWLEENLPKDSTVAVSAAFLPSGKNSKEIDINPTGPTTLMSMSELKKAKVGWVLISSYFTANVNSQYWITNNLVQDTFFNDKLFWEIINDTYISLNLNEVGAYRIKEFVKPFWQSPERAFFVAKIPDSWQIKKDELIFSHSFNSLREQNFFRKILNLDKKPQAAFFSSEVGYGDLSSMSLDTIDCNIKSKLISDKFQMSGNKWYSAIGMVKRESNPVYALHKDGFLRLDFYSKENDKLKTYVSQLTKSSEDWQELALGGLAPIDVKYGTITFQLDKCIPGEKYFIDNLELYSSNDSPVDIASYPYYDKPIPKNFLWLPEL